MIGLYRRFLYFYLVLIHGPGFASLATAFVPINACSPGSFEHNLVGTSTNGAIKSFIPARKYHRRFEICANALSTKNSSVQVPSLVVTSTIDVRSIKIYASLGILLSVLGISLLQQEFPVAGLLRDANLSLFLIVETIIWLKMWALVVVMGWMPSTLTRKIIHTLSAPLFMFHWPFFTNYEPLSSSRCKIGLQRLIVAVVPFLQIAKFYFAGTSTNDATNETNHNKTGVTNRQKDEIISAISRSGSQNEALGGPFLYAIALFVLTMVFFRDSPIGIVAISQMAAGDGLADIVGRKFGKRKWYFSPTKSVEGSIAFFISGFFCSYSLLYWILGSRLDMTRVVIPLMWISFASAAVELFSNMIDDNIVVPVVSSLLTYFFIPC